MTTATHGETALAAGWTSRAEGLVAELDDARRARLGRVPADVPRPRHRRLRRRPAACADEAAERRPPPPRPRPDRPGAVLARDGWRSTPGRVAEGLALLDESMVRVIAGETLADHRRPRLLHRDRGLPGDQRLRAGWRSGPSALERWCAAQPGLLAFTGQCAVHRGQLLRLRGEWQRALDEFELAARRYQRGRRTRRGRAGGVRGRRGAAAARRVRPRPTTPTSAPPTTASTRSPAWRCCGSARGRSAAALGRDRPAAGRARRAGAAVPAPARRGRGAARAPARSTGPGRSPPSSTALAEPLRLRARWRPPAAQASRRGRAGRR